MLPDAELTADEVARRDAGRDRRSRGSTSGPFPYETLTVALLPDYGGGIEYPGLILQATPSPRCSCTRWRTCGSTGWSATRSSATRGSTRRSRPGPRRSSTGTRACVDEDGPGAGGAGRRRDGRLPGQPRTYFRVVYDKGGAALLAAREAAGAEAFDAAIRCYVDASAWTIATPEDVGRALADLPEALAVLNRAGALDKDDVPR